MPLIVSNKHKKTKKHLLLLDAVGKTESLRTLQFFPKPLGAQDIISLLLDKP